MTGNLTELGRAASYATKEERQSHVCLQIIRGFTPFWDALTYLVAQGNEETRLESVEAFWGKRGVGSSDRNRKDGSLVFAHFTQAAGLCNFRLGRGGGESRLQWKEDAKERLEVPEEIRKVALTAIPEEIATARSGAPRRQEVTRHDFETEAFRLVLPTGEANLSVPRTMGERDLASMRIQLEAIMRVLQSRFEGEATS